MLSCIWGFATLWTVAHKSPLTLGFCRQEYGNGLPCLPPGDLPNPGIEPMFPASPHCRQILYLKWTTSKHWLYRTGNSAQCYVAAWMGGGFGGEWTHGQVFPRGSVVKNPPAKAGDAGNMGSIPGSGRSSGRRHGNPLQDSCLGNSMDREAWWTTVHGVTRV